MQEKANDNAEIEEILTCPHTNKHHLCNLVITKTDEKLEHKAVIYGLSFFIVWKTLTSHQQYFSHFLMRKYHTIMSS